MTARLVAGGLKSPHRIVTILPGVSAIWIGLDVAWNLWKCRLIMIKIILSLKQKYMTLNIYIYKYCKSKSNINKKYKKYNVIFEFFQL